MSNKAYIATIVIMFIIIACLVSYIAAGIIQGKKDSDSGFEASDIDYDADTIEEVEAIKVSGKPTIVVFGADYCNVCVNYRPYVKELNNLYGDKITIKFINSKEHEAVRSEYNIEFIPTTLFFDADGNAFFPSDEIEVTPSTEVAEERKYVSDTYEIKSGEELGLSTDYEYGVDSTGEIKYCKFVGLITMSQLKEIAEDMLK
jgi:thiol-disulfide isomerase/thioredoxin